MFFEGDLPPLNLRQKRDFVVLACLDHFDGGVDVFEG